MRKPKPKSFSSFAQKVYGVVRRIPKGKTMTYGAVARAAGKSRAARAVGMLMSRNWDPKIPCHRVVRADGKPGGYNRGGWVVKERILRNELRRA